MSKFGTINYPHEVFTKQAWLATLTCTIISRMTTASFESLSGDVLLEIAGLLSRPDILHLSLTSSSVYAQVIGALYNVVELQNAVQCFDTLNMLHHQPGIARHVKKLTLRPDFVSPRFIPNKSSPPNARLVTAAIKRTAPCLDALQTFVWVGEEYPTEDDIWFVLRTSCTQLKSIAVSFGSVLPGIKSHLFDFHDLHGFAVSFEPGFFRNMLFEISPETEPVIRRLWDMLINRCPDLRELSINTNGVNPVELVDAHRLCRGRWPNLRRLQLGNVTVDWQPNATGDRTPFMTFLKDHTSLESLRLSPQFGIAPEDFAELNPVSFPKLVDFSGSVDILQALPHSMAFKSIHIPQPLVVRDFTHTNISTILQSKSSLVSLKVSFILQSGYDSIGVLRSIAFSCPRLRHLDITCSHKPSFSLDAFARAIRSLSRLQSFNLTIVKVHGDESMCDGAARIARFNPRLHEFSITYIQHSAVIYKISEKGDFELTCDDHGLPVSLFTRQRKHRIWGVSSQSHRCDLRPVGHPGIAKMGWIALALDRGQAGRDLRMLAISVLLVSMTLWAFLIHDAS